MSAGRAPGLGKDALRPGPGPADPQRRASAGKIPGDQAPASSAPQPRRPEQDRGVRGCAAAPTPPAPRPASPPRCRSRRTSAAILGRRGAGRNTRARCLQTWFGGGRSVPSPVASRPGKGPLKTAGGGGCEIRLFKSTGGNVLANLLRCRGGGTASQPWGWGNGQQRTDRAPFGARRPRRKPPPAAPRSMVQDGAGGLEHTHSSLRAARETRESAPD